MDAHFVQHDRRCYAKHLCHSGHRVMAGTFCVIPSAARNPVWMLHFAYAPFSMTRWCHSERSFLSFQVLFFCHSERSFLSFRARARNPVWMLHFAYALFSMTDDVIPNAVRNPVWKCKGVQQGGDGEPHPLVPLLRKERDVSASPKQGEVIQHGCSLCSA